MYVIFETHCTGDEVTAGINVIWHLRERGKIVFEKWLGLTTTWHYLRDKGWGRPRRHRRKKSKARVKYEVLFSKTHLSLFLQRRKTQWKPKERSEAKGEKYFIDIYTHSLLEVTLTHVQSFNRFRCVVNRLPLSACERVVKVYSTIQSTTAISR